MIGKIKNSRWAIGWFICITIAGSCQKSKITDLPDVDQKDLKEVTFKVRNFEKEIHPLLRMDKFDNEGGISDILSVYENGNVPPSEIEQTLYFWSFNQQNTVPDIGIDLTGASIDFESYSSSGKETYPAGRAFSSYPAGQAYSINGAKWIRFKIPVQQISQLGVLSFDATSSGTGPKSFDVFYSLEDEFDLKILASDNQFENTKDNGWNRFEYDVSFLDLETVPEILWIQIELKSGDRGDGGNYNENTGSFRIDNIGLTGIYSTDLQPDPELDNGTIHYYLFSKQDSILVKSGKKAFTGGKNGVPQVDLQLAEGIYFGIFIINFSTQDLVIPSDFDKAGDLYIRNRFDNYESIIYGATINDFIVEENIHKELIAERYYNEVYFRFGDDSGLDRVGRIEITEIVPRYFFPFLPDENVSSNNENIDGNNSFSMVPNWPEETQEIRFRHFLGLLDDPLTVIYEVNAYGDEGELLRNFTVEASIFNNTILIFSGNLLDLSGTTGFPIVWDENWKETKLVSF